MPGDEAVRDAFVRWVSAQTAAPRNPAALIDHLEISHDYAGLLETDVRGRKVIWKWVPAAARTRVTPPAGATDDVDAWTVDPTALRERSIHIALCHVCAGEKKTRCSACGGSGKALCQACNGQRKAYGYASNGAYRLLNCTACRGKGEVDCAHCRRGIAVCSTCAGEGRLQRWMEVESWQRSVSKTHPEAVALQFAWDESPTNEAITRDADLFAEAEVPHQLAPGDLSGVSEEWLTILRPEVTPEERIERQRLRIARVPSNRVHYRLGNDEDLVTFNGLRLSHPASASNAPFARRAGRLRALRVLLIAIAIVTAIASLGRGAFFLSADTFVSLLACGAALTTIDLAAADWTAARLHTGPWLIVAASFLVVAIVFAVAALPSVAHARKLIAAGDLDRAEAELHILRDTSPSLGADLRLARIRQATQIEDARGSLHGIPRTLPQYALATKAIDQLILRTARGDERTHRWSEASAALALLSDSARGLPDTVSLAESVCVASARENIERRDWGHAAKDILAARHTGVASTALEPLHGAIRTAAVDEAEKAHQVDDAPLRLKQRLAAEAAFVAWDSATESWGTPPLIVLRTAMAHDIAAIERSRQRHHKG